MKIRFIEPGNRPYRRSLLNYVVYDRYIRTPSVGLNTLATIVKQETGFSRDCVEGKGSVYEHSYAKAACQYRHHCRQGFDPQLSEDGRAYDGMAAGACVAGMSAQL